MKEILFALKEIGSVFETANFPVSLPDPFDEIYLLAALSAQASVLITGNRQDFPADRCGGVQICSPGEFLRLLGRS